MARGKAATAYSTVDCRLRLRLRRYLQSSSLGSRRSLVVIRNGPRTGERWGEVYAFVFVGVGGRGMLGGPIPAPAPADAREEPWRDGEEAYRFRGMGVETESEWTKCR